MRRTPGADIKGPRRICEVEPNTTVLGFDFSTGSWTERIVQKRHQNPYTGPLIRITFDDDVIEVTEHHPFWVVSGRGLHSRPFPAQLHVGEDEGGSLSGRWVNYHEFAAEGDVVSAISGDRRVVKVESEDVVDLPVYNLTVENDHTLPSGRLFKYHSRFSLVQCMEKLKGNATALKALAKVQGFKEAMIHAHHIVMKTIPKRYL